MSKAGRSGKLLALVLLKCAIALLILYYLLSRFATKSVVESLLQIKWWAVGGGVLLLALQLVLTALRSHLILRQSGSVVDFPTMLRIALAGSFYSQTMVSFIGGDGARIWLLAQKGVPPAVSSYVVILDRLVGLFAQLIFLLATLPVLFLMRVDAALQGPLLILGIGGLLCVATVIGLFGVVRYLRSGDSFVSRHLRGLSSINVEMMRDPHFVLRMALLSTAIVLINAFCVYIYFRGVSVDVGLQNVLLITPAVFLVSMVPISIAGWGVREGAMSAGFALVGIDPEKSIIVSIAFGLSLAIVSLPGSFTGLRVLSGPAEVAR